MRIAFGDKIAFRAGPASRSVPTNRARLSWRARPTRWQAMDLLRNAVLAASIEVRSGSSGKPLS